MLPLCFRHLRTLSEWVCHVAPSQKSYEVSDNASLCSTTRRSHKAKCSLEGHTQCHTSCASQQSGAGPQPDTLMSTTQIAHSMILHALLTPSTELCTSWRRASSCFSHNLLIWQQTCRQACRQFWTQAQQNWTSDLCDAHPQRASFCQVAGQISLQRLQ